MFMEIKVGFHPLDIDFRAKAKVYYDGVCYLRNYSQFDRTDEWLNPEGFISEQAQ